VATLPTPTCLTSHSFEDFNDDDDLSQDNSIFSSLRNVDLVSSYLRDSASKDADLQADAAKAPALDDPADDEASADEQDGAVAAPPVPVAPAPAPASILRVPPSRPATKRGGNANMVAFLGGYKQTQARGLLKLGVASDIASRAKNIRKRTAETALQRKLAEAKMRIPAEFQDMAGVVGLEKRNKTRTVV